MPSRLTGFVCPTVSMVTTGHATGVEKTLLALIPSFSLTAVHTILHDLLPPSTYFRFNPYLSDEFLLDEISEDRWELMRQDALMYCRKNEAKLNTAGEQLRQTKMPHQKAGDWIRQTADRMS